MATRIERTAMPQRGQATTEGDNDTTRLFGVVRDEPFVEAGQPLGLAPRDSLALARQRGMDLMLATLCLVFLWPVMLVATILVMLSGPGPVFYSQPRFGRNGVIFGCLKFRTMQVDADRKLQELLDSSPVIQEIWKQHRKLLDDPRITLFGRFLRRYSIDELPQLFNVLRGEMSIVGPRPLATDEAHFYADAFTVYCSIRPGITGPWQVSGRNQISFAGRARLDCEYARTKSVGQDLRIILRTIPVVLRGTGY